MIKTFEEYDYVHDNSFVWITGIPSGEALQIPYENLNALYAEKLIWYDNKYTGTGFYAFNDDDIDLVKRYKTPPKKGKELTIKKPKIKSTKSPIIMIKKNKFDQYLIDTVVGIINEYPTEIELYVQDEFLGITYGMNGELYIEIEVDESKSPKFYLTKRIHAKCVDGYGISTDKQLIDRIESELYV